MDISLYDSTGTTKITDTTGLSVDITIPIPDALLSYGGNNMAGAVVDYNPVENAQLEELSEKFTTINGVPCVTFTATHFSPYTVYVDTGNLTEGMLDVTLRQEIQFIRSVLYYLVLHVCPLSYLLRKIKMRKNKDGIIFLDNPNGKKIRKVIGALLTALAIAVTIPVSDGGGETASASILKWMEQH